MGDEVIKTDENGNSGCVDTLVTFNEDTLTLVTRTPTANAASQSSSVDAADSSTNPAITANILCLATSVKENTDVKNDLMIYPNPATATCSIISKEVLETNDFMISDLTGRRIVCPIMKSSNSNDLQLDCSKLNPGVYILSVPTRSGVLTQKFLKI
jgi:hypothetical protein